MEKPNVLLITVDCLRPDHLGCYGYLKDISPNIDNLASKGALFLEAISNGGRTPDSFPSILASQLPPLTHDEYRKIMKRSPTLAGLMKEAGYGTAAFHSNAFISKFYNYDKGFDVFQDDVTTLASIRRRKDRIIRPAKKRQIPRIFIVFFIIAGNIFNHLRFSLGGHLHLDAEKLTKGAISWLNTCPDNFFLWIHYMDVHYPYLPPPEYARKFCKRRVSRSQMSSLYHKLVRNFRRAERMSAKEMDSLVCLYDANISYVDYNIGRLLESLGSRLENTLVIITADHGEAFAEHNTLGHVGILYEELVHVPLIIKGLGIEAGTVIKEPVELMDLSPTVAEMAALGSVDGFHGSSLLPVISGNKREAKGFIATRQVPEIVQRCISYRTPEWKYIRTEKLDELNTLVSEEVYNLRDDPRERNNLYGLEDSKARAFASEAVKKILEFKKLKREEETAYEKARIRARLKKIPKL